MKHEKKNDFLLHEDASRMGKKDTESKKWMIYLMCKTNKKFIWFDW